MRSLARVSSCAGTRCLAAAAVLMCIGCGSTTLLSQLPSAEQTKYRGTEPGWHALSPYFAVDIKSNGKATFYHLRDPEDPKARDAIGRQDVYWPTGELVIDKNKFGPRNVSNARNPRRMFFDSSVRSTRSTSLRSPVARAITRRALRTAGSRSADGGDHLHPAGQAWPHEHARHVDQGRTRRQVDWRVCSSVTSWIIR